MNRVSFIAGVVFVCCLSGLQAQESAPGFAVVRRLRAEARDRAFRYHTARPRRRLPLERVLELDNSQPELNLHPLP